MLRDGDARAVWNWACSGSQHDGRPGNEQLARLLLLHGVAMNNGPLSAVTEFSPPELSASLQAYRSIGLHAAADMLEVLALVDQQALSDAAADDLEQESMGRYFGLTESDDQIEDAFLLHFHEHPDLYLVPPSDDADSGRTASADLRSKWNHGGLHVSKLFGLVRIEADRLTVWVTLPVLWRTGVRFARRNFTIDRTRSAYRRQSMNSLYIPIEDRDWIRTSISGVESSLRAAGVPIEAGKPHP